MGAPKQKWTSEEEAALKAGIAKYGAGKWSTILKDPQFSTILRSRSNVDLKDKWRNMNVMASGWGSRQRARLAIKSNQVTPKHDENSTTHSPPVEEIVHARPVEISGGPLENGSDAAPVASSHEAMQNVVYDVKPLATSQGPLQRVGSKKPISRLDNLILEAITNLKEPHGSNRTAIAMYIEEQYMAPLNFERLLATNLKLLTENRKLIKGVAKPGCLVQSAFSLGVPWQLGKVKHQYRIAPRLTSFDVRRDSSPPQEGKQKDSPKVETNKIKILTKAQIDAELEMMRNMTAEEAAAVAAQAVAEAEAAIAEAEEAAREAEEAEAEAEVAKCFAEAATKALKCRTVHA
ncbi:unnamed protein product [Ilex paraguariensis]|uniref:MYB transcription factor n=1 Tax=Ilex paraguariensis TaxID=185542 RepID=A0ABC8RTU1_9AQUA